MISAARRSGRAAAFLLASHLAAAFAADASIQIRENDILAQG
jgi:hypothetical protein